LGSLQRSALAMMELLQSPREIQPVLQAAVEEIRL